MKPFYLMPLYEHGPMKEAGNRISAGRGPVAVSGCVESQKAQVIAFLSEETGFSLVVCADEMKATALAEDLKFFTGKLPLVFPPKDVIFYQADVTGFEISRKRVRVLKALCEETHGIVVTTVDACMNLLPEKEIWAKRAIHLQSGNEVEPKKLARLLVELGYSYESQVDLPGQFAIRGDIIDIFPLTEDVPVRVELWGDEIDTIRSFDPESQRSIEQLEEVLIYPAREWVPDEGQMAVGVEKIRKEFDKALGERRKNKDKEGEKNLRHAVGDPLSRMEIGAFSGALGSFAPYFMGDTPKTLLDFFPKEVRVFLDEPTWLLEKMEVVENEFSQSITHRLETGYLLPGQTRQMLSKNLCYGTLVGNRTTALSSLSVRLTEKTFYLDTACGSLSAYKDNITLLIEDLKRWKKQRYRVAVLYGSQTRAERMATQLLDEDLNVYYREHPDEPPKPGEVQITCGMLHRGFVYHNQKTVFITEADMFGKRNTDGKKRKRFSGGEAVGSLDTLSVGDYVIHENHGLGRYLGIERIEVDYEKKDYIKIEYANGGYLYVPAAKFDQISKYGDSDMKAPKLNKLGSLEWEKTKTRVRTAVKDMAKELVALYAQRSREQGHVYGPDTAWQKEFEENFPFEETADQLTAIEETKRDMEDGKVMDRLICGDVGYGKTEVALRAAFKAVQDGKQVAVLVPTTILAQQHYHTFSERMQGYPVTVGQLSRFQTPGQIKETLADLSTGKCDIVIGTHRLLSKDVSFLDLGLLIVDEEQRFGVAHKEKIKQLKKNVDVLTLSATPIPRTLHMSLSGIRDMSVLEEAPNERVPIQTYVMEHSDEVVREAITRELSRGGQVYYVYNRVEDIATIADHIASLVPDMTVAYAHGQMGERELERIMLDFINGEIDVLVSTTIIETGLDISNVNTIIIHDANRFGLAQLYQLRGRVGRSNRVAYAFILYQRGRILSEVAEKRLSAIREFSELGSGIRIAMRDLEIRGAGNVLGAEQHGHMMAVGYDLYCRMLKEAVEEEKGEGKAKETLETTVEAHLDACIPPEYIGNERVKLGMYKRIAQISDEDDYRDLIDELNDRFGEVPTEVLTLMQAALIKAMAHALFIEKVELSEKTIKLSPVSGVTYRFEKVNELLSAYKGHLTVKVTGDVPVFTLVPDKGKLFTPEQQIKIVKKLLNDMKSLPETEK